MITLTDNDFFTGLANLAIYMRLYSTTNGSMAQSFVDKFATETLDNGDTKIFPYADLPSVSNYSETSSLLTVTKVTTGEETISITEKKVIKSSYSRQILEMAFTSDSGMNIFVGYLMGQMDSAKTKYLYEDIVNSFANISNTYLAGSSQDITIQITNPNSAATAQEKEFINLNNQKKVALAIQNYIQNIQVFSSNYNSKGLSEALDLSDLRLLVNGSWDNEQIINLFATLLKSEYIQNSFAKPEKLVVPSDYSIGGTANTPVVAFIMHKRFFQYFYKFTFMGSFFDVSNLVVNNFLHFWYGKGFLGYLPCVRISLQFN